MLHIKIEMTVLLLFSVETRFVRDFDLEVIGHLSSLKRLTLAGLPGLISGHSLVCIAEGCHQLQFMSLAYLGGPSFSGALCKALPFCKKLRDLRLVPLFIYMYKLLCDVG